MVDGLAYRLRVRQLDWAILGSLEPKSWGGDLR